MRPLFLRALCLAGLAALAALAARPAAAEWPERAVTVIHPYGPGTASDATARSIAEAFAARFGQPFPVVNRDGAAGVVGTRSLAASAPDGYTILIGPMTAITSQPHLVRNTGLGPDAVVPICNVSANLLGIVVRADSSFRNGHDVVAAARQRSLSFGSTGRVSLSALAVHRLQAVTGDGQHYVSIPFRSDGASLTELLGGRLDFSSTLIANATPQIRAGALRLIGVFADRRYPDLPDVPTFAEQGIDAQQMSYAGILAPPGTPEPIVAKLEEACAAAMHSAPFRRAVEQFGIVVDHRGRRDFARLLADEYRDIGAVLQELGVRTE
jgi:tripartite-type tricarboxylate transporter receptor subunit TctC